MKFRQILLFIILATLGIFLYFINKEKKHLSQKSGGFNRKTTLVVSSDSLNWIDLDTNYTRDYYIGDTTPKGVINFYNLNETPLCSKKFDSIIYFANLDSQYLFKKHFKYEKNIPIRKLPNFTLRVSIIDTNILACKVFDPIKKENKISIYNDSNLFEFRSPFKNIDDGGLSTDGDIVHNDSNLFFIYQYANIIYKIKYKNPIDTFLKYESIEKISELPEIAKKTNSYSFKKIPIWVHAGCILTYNQLIILSIVRDDEAKRNKLKNFIFFDFYDCETMKYIHSILLTNINPEILSDFKIFGKSIVITVGNRYTHFLIN